jgi:hypothetical protein
VEGAPGPSSLLAQISTLRFPPAPVVPERAREVFNRLSRLQAFNYLHTADGATLSTPPRESGEQIRVVLGHDTLHVSFDPTLKSAEFAAQELVELLREIVGVLAVPVFIHQVHVIRKTLPLPPGVDARTFLVRDVAAVPPERLAGFKRPFAAAGLRFVFPPQQMNDLSAHDLRIETFLPDPSKLFLEDTATYLVPLPAGQWDQIKANLADANRFLDGYARALLTGSPAPDG